MNDHIISKDKQYKTRDGRKVVILADSGPDDDYPVVGLVIEKDGQADHYQWTNEGKFISDYNCSCELDLFPEPVTVEYAIVWDDGSQMRQSTWYSTKDNSFTSSVGHMVRTTEEGNPPVYHFEPK